MMQVVISSRKIIHVDMDAFYAAVEQHINPKLRGKPVIVGGRPKSRGVVSTCSYEARCYGVRSAMPITEAYRRCPQGFFIDNPNFREYVRVSKKVHKIFHSFTELVEPLSLDEAYLDVTTNKQSEPSATRLAEKIRQCIREETGLTASAGVSYNKSLAKIASDWKKPDGLMVIPPKRALVFLSALPVQKFFGIGPVTARRMQALGIQTGGDLRQFSMEHLMRQFGKMGPWYYQICRGIDNRPICTDREQKSLGKERTFETNMTNIHQMREFLSQLSTSVWNTLQENHLRWKTTTLKVKYADFRQVTRRRTANDAPRDLEEFRNIVMNLLKKTEASRLPVRLLGVSTSAFIQEVHEPGQLSLDLPLT